MPSDDDLRKEPYGIILLAGFAGVIVLIALWTVLGAVQN